MPEVGSQANARFATCGILVSSLDLSLDALKAMATDKLRTLTGTGTAIKVIIMRGRGGGSADADPVIAHLRSRALGATRTLKSKGASLTSAAGTPRLAGGMRSLRSTRTNIDVISKPLAHKRATRIVCTLGPSCWGVEGLRGLLDAGCDIVRLNFSHGSHNGAHA